MKKVLALLSFMLLYGTTLIAQQGGGGMNPAAMKERMKERMKPQFGWANKKKQQTLQLNKKNVPQY